LKKGGRLAALLFTSTAFLWPSGDGRSFLGCRLPARRHLDDANRSQLRGAPGGWRSRQLARWGESGPGRWISVYANRRHVFMLVAGLRFDTRGNPQGVSGPRWHRGWVVPSEFTARHPYGL
jgi:hypothetical protein